MTDLEKFGGPEEYPVVKALVRLVPKGNVVVDLWRDLSNRQERRISEFAQALGDVCEDEGTSAEEVLRRVLDDDELQDLLAAAIAAASRASSDAKIRALARAVVSGVLAADDARVDLAPLIVRALDNLNSADIRFFLRLRPFGTGIFDFGETESERSQRPTPFPSAGSVVRIPKLEFPDEATREVLLAQLVQVGMLQQIDSTEITGNAEDGDVENKTDWHMTSFGREVRKYLERVGEDQTQ